MESSRVRLYKGLFSITLIAIFMTVFELFFYIYIVHPTIKIFVKQLIENQPLNKIDPRLEHVLTIMKNRELILISEINFGSYATIIVEIALMIIFLLYIYARIDSSNFITLFEISFITLFILISFQIMFFYFGRNYVYLGDNEIKVIFYDIFIY